MRGSLAAIGERWSEAVPLYRKAYEAFDDDGDGPAAWTALTQLAVALAAAGEHPAAAATVRECVARTPSSGAAWSRSGVLATAAFVAWRAGDLDGVRHHAREALSVKHDLDDPVGTARCLELFGWVAARGRRFEQAARLLGAAAKLWPAVRHLPELRPEHDVAVSHARGSLGAESYRRAFRRGTETVDAMLSGLLRGRREQPKRPEGPVAKLLTPREREVAALVAGGLTNRRIAADLAIAQRTVEAHIESILLKLNLRSRAQIAAWSVTALAAAD